LNFNILEKVILSETIIERIVVEAFGPISSARLALTDASWETARQIALRVEYRSGYRPTLPQLLYRFYRRKAAHPLDKIYSLHSLCSNKAEIMDVDYGRPFREVYTRIAILIMSLYKNLDIFSFMSRYPSAYRDDIPSWVPSFRYHMDERDVSLPLASGIFEGKNSFDLFKAGGFRVAEISARIVDRYRTLELDAIVFDTISGKIDLCDLSPPTILETSVPSAKNTLSYEAYEKQVRDRLKRALAMAQFHLKKFSSTEHSLESYRSPLDASWRTLLADQWPPGQHLHRSTLGRSEIPPRTKREEESLLAEPGLVLGLKFIAGRKMFITGGGFIGLGPSLARPGDKIAVMPGGAVPYVLRDTNDPGHFRFIGEW
jgi:hypothetical protein